MRFVDPTRLNSISNPNIDLSTDLTWDASVGDYVLDRYYNCCGPFVPVTDLNRVQPCAIDLDSNWPRRTPRQIANLYWTRVSETCQVCSGIWLRIKLITWRQIHMFTQTSKTHELPLLLPRTTFCTCEIFGGYIFSLIGHHLNSSIFRSSAWTFVFCGPTNSDEPTRRKKVIDICIQESSHRAWILIRRPVTSACFKVVCSWTALTLHCPEVRLFSILQGLSFAVFSRRFFVGRKGLVTGGRISASHKSRLGTTDGGSRVARVTGKSRKMVSEPGKGKMNACRRG